MKEQDLFIDLEYHNLVYYVEMDDHSYGPIISGSHITANYLEDFIAKKKNLEASLRKQLISDEISPVQYYMILQEIGPKDLASRLGISLKNLNKICKPKYFSKLKIEKLKILAEIFNIPVANLFHTYLIKNNDQDKLEIKQELTKNGIYSITKISIK